MITLTVRLHFFKNGFPALKTVVVFPVRRTALLFWITVLIQLHSISWITTLTCDGEALASGDPNSPARTCFILSPCQHCPHCFNLISFILDIELVFLPAEQSLEEIKKILLLLLGCAVQVNGYSVMICVQKTGNRLHELK